MEINKFIDIPLDVIFDVVYVGNYSPMCNGVELIYGKFYKVIFWTESRDRLRIVNVDNEFVNIRSENFDLLSVVRNSKISKLLE